MGTKCAPLLADSYILNKKKERYIKFSLKLHIFSFEYSQGIYSYMKLLMFHGLFEPPW